MLSIKLLGSPQITYNDRPLQIPRRLSRVLLFYLAATGQAIGRQQLALLFWPDSPDEKVRRLLTDNLSKLREALPDRDLIISKQDTISLDLTRVSSDVLTFRSLLDQVGRSPWITSEDTPLSPAVHQALQQAAELWYGDSLMSGLDLSPYPEVEDWHFYLDGQLQTERLNILKRLGKHEHILHNHPQALKWFTQANRLDNLDEDIHYAILQCLLEAKNFSEAQKHYLKIEKIYRRELDEDVPEKILALHPHIISPNTTPIQKESPTWPIRPSLEAPFIGRTQLLDELETIYRRGGATVVYGETGIGKTRLVQEFCQRAQPSPRLLLATCKAMQSGLPFQPLIDLLRNAIQPGEWKHVSPVWIGYLTQLLPELKQEFPATDPLPELGSPQFRTRLFETIHQTLSTLIRKQPLIFFLDDAQWADESTLSALAYLLDQNFFASPDRILILASRQEENNPHLDRFTLNTYNQRIKQLEIDMLTQQEIGELAYHIFGDTAQIELLQQLEEETGGNPFFLLETFRALLETTNLSGTAKIKSLPVTASVHQLIQNRLRRISAADREVLSAAALVGRQFDPQMIETICELSEQETVRILERLEAAHLIQSLQNNQPLVGYIFVHDLIRENLLQAISAARKRMYHSKIAKALEQRPDRNAALLAVHCEEAGEPNKAFQFWIEAGEQAHAISSLEEAEAAFQRAERLIPHCPTLNDEQIHYLYLLWDDMAYQVNNTETLKRIHQTQLNIGQSRNSALLTGAALDGQGNACMTANQFEAGLEYAQKALVWLEGTNHIFERMEVLNHRGTFHYMLGHMDIALESFQAALELCENASVPLDRWMLRARGNTNYYIAQIQTLKIWPKIGEEYALKALNDYVACKHPYGQASAYSVLTLAHYHLGNFEEGIRVGQIGIELAERISAWRILGNLHSYCAMNEFERGFLGPAWDHIQKALDLGNRFGHGETLAIAYRTIGDIYDRLWSNDKALDAYKKGIEAGGSHFLSQDNLMGMGTTLAQSNQEIGEQYIQQAIIQTEKIGSDSLYGSFSLLYLETMSGMANENTISRIRKGADEAKKREWGYVHHGLLFLLAKALLENGHLQESLSITNELIRFDSLWHKLLANNLQIHIFQALELSDVQPFADQERYISEIEAHLGDAPLQEEWQTFKQMLLSTSEP